MSQTPFLDVYSGNKEEFDAATNAYDATVAFLRSKGATYGLPVAPEELDEEQREILRDLAVSSLAFMTCKNDKILTIS